MNVGKDITSYDITWQGNPQSFYKQRNNVIMTLFNGCSEHNIN